MPATPTAVYQPVNALTGVMALGDGATAETCYCERLEADVFYLEHHPAQRKAGQTPGYVCGIGPPHCPCGEFQRAGTCRHAAALVQLRQEGVI